MERAPAPALSQVIFGVTDLEAAADRFRSMGFDVLDGGIHPGLGTANRVIPLGGEYLELLGVVSLTEARHNSYGRALLRAIEGGDRIVRWSLRTEDVDEVAARLGLLVERRRRLRPDGVEVTWRAAGIDLALIDATLPFFMQWDLPEQYPGAMTAAHPNGARRVCSLRITPREPNQFRVWTAGSDAPLRVVDLASSGIWSVTVETDAGEMVVRG